MLRQLVVLGAIGLASSAWAAQPPNAPIDEEPTVAPEEAKGLGWIQLVSGEWLRGAFRRVRADSLSFKSDQLGNQSLDFDNVHAAYLTNSHRWIMKDLERDYVGPGVVWGDKILINDEVDGLVEVKRSQVLGILKGSPRELDNWSYNLNLGFDASAGNTEQLNLSASTQLTREDLRTRWDVGYGMGYGLANNLAIKHNHRAFTKFDVFMTPALYIRAFDLAMLNDRFQNLDARLTAAAGIGLRYEPISVLEFGGGLNGAFQQVYYFQTAPGNDPTFTGGGVTGNVYLRWDVNATSVFRVDWLTALMFNDLGKTYHHGEINWNQGITTIIDMNAAVIYDRTEQPPPLADGTIVKSDDISFVVGFGLVL